MKKMKKTLAMLIAVCMVVTMMPLMAFADDDTGTAPADEIAADAAADEEAGGEAEGEGEEADAPEEKPAAPSASASSFTDISRSHWAYTYVSDVVAKGYFSGTSSTTFEPETSMTRAMFVTVLKNMDGTAANNSASVSFSDVPSGQWYTGAVAWAAQNNIVSGTSETTFEPETAITREQMAAIIVRYADYANIPLNVTVSATTFSDAGSISDYAKDAVATCQKAGLISGMGDGTFAPKGTATRAQVAVIISLLSSVSDDGLHTVTFNSNGGSAVEPQKVADGAKAVRPTNPTRSGYNFDAWYSDQELTEKYDFNTAVTSSFTLYAGWNESTGGGGGGGGRGGSGGEETAKPEYVDKVVITRGVMDVDTDHIDVYTKSNYYITGIRYNGELMGHIDGKDENVWRIGIYGSAPTDMEAIYRLISADAWEEIITGASWVGYNGTFGTNAYVYVADDSKVQNITIEGQTVSYDAALKFYAANLQSKTSGTVKVSILYDKQPLEYTLNIIPFN